MVKKKKAKKKKALQNLEKVLDKVKDTRLKDDVRNLIKVESGFSFRGSGESIPSFNEVEEEPQIVERKPVVLERVVALESPSTKEEKKEINYQGAGNDYGKIKSEENTEKYLGSSNYDRIKRSSINYEEQAINLDIRSQEHKEASIAANKGEKLGELTILSDLELRETKKDVLSQDLIGESLTGKDYKLGRKSTINKGDYVKEYE